MTSGYWFSICLDIQKVWDECKSDAEPSELLLSVLYDEGEDTE